MPARAPSSPYAHCEAGESLKAIRQELPIAPWRTAPLSWRSAWYGIPIGNRIPPWLLGKWLLGNPIRNDYQKWNGD
jgi:hypothetical protein